MYSLDMYSYVLCEIDDNEKKQRPDCRDNKSHIYHYFNNNFPFLSKRKQAQVCNNTRSSFDMVEVLKLLIP